MELQSDVNDYLSGDSSSCLNITCLQRFCVFRQGLLYTRDALRQNKRPHMEAEIFRALKKHNFLQVEVSKWPQMQG